MLEVSATTGIIIIMIIIIFCMVQVQVHVHKPLETSSCDTLFFVGVVPDGYFASNLFTGWHRKTHNPCERG